MRTSSIFGPCNRSHADGQRMIHVEMTNAKCRTTSQTIRFTIFSSQQHEHLTDSTSLLQLWQYRPRAPCRLVYNCTHTHTRRTHHGLHFIPRSKVHGEMKWNEIVTPRGRATFKWNLHCKIISNSFFCCYCFAHWFWFSRVHSFRASFIYICFHFFAENQEKRVKKKMPGILFAVVAALEFTQRNSKWNELKDDNRRWERELESEGERLRERKSK